MMVTPPATIIEMRKKRPNGRWTQASTKLPHSTTEGKSLGGTANTSSLPRSALGTIQKDGKRNSRATTVSPTCVSPSSASVVPFRLRPASDIVAHPFLLQPERGAGGAQGQEGQH